MLLSMKIEEHYNQQISSLSRGGLWTPDSSVVSIGEVAELVFRRYTDQEKVTSLPVEKMVDEVLSSPLVQSLWENALGNCELEISKECRNLAIENIVKLYLTVRCFSFAKDIVNKYKISQGVKTKRALRKGLKGKLNNVIIILYY